MKEVKQTIFGLIEEANKEYALNGRSEQFVSYENKVLKCKKAKLIYLFARYVKGCDVALLEQAILNTNAMREGYFFVRYVKGADVTKFLEKAKDSNELVWLKHLCEIAEKQGIRTGRPKPNKTKEAGKLDIIISKAQTLDYKELLDWEKSNFNSINIVDHIIYASKVKLADYDLIEDDILMHGNPLNCLVAAKDVESINKSRMLAYAMLAKYDYAKLEDEEIILKNLHKQLAEAIKYKASKGTKITDKQRVDSNTIIENLQRRISYHEENPNFAEYSNAICREIKQVIATSKSLNN